MRLRFGVLFPALRLRTEFERTVICEPRNFSSLDARAHRSWWCAVVLTTLFPATAITRAHIYIPQDRRAGAYPDYEGGGWKAEVFLNIPDESAIHLIAAENYVEDRQPDFTFRTDWIDFPAGESDSELDADFQTMGDFLDDYIYDVSDPSKLDAPFCSFLIRFTGYLKVRLEDESRIRGGFIGLPVWVDLGSLGYDGYRTRVGGETTYVNYDANLSGPWTQFGPSIELLGLYPIEFTFYNRYDPDGSLGAPRAGVELYSWHAGGLTLPGGMNMVHSEFGPGTIVPPSVIFQAQDVVPAVRGDFDGDADIDFADFRWFQVCFEPPDGGFVILASGCDWLDMDGDGDVDLDDYRSFEPLAVGP